MNVKFLTWDAWPSNNSNKGLCGDGLVCYRKWLNQILKSGIVIQPDLLQLKMLSAGAPFFSCSVSRVRGKMNMGGRKCPVAETHIHAVERIPRSADVIQPTCLLPFNARIFDILDCTCK